MNRTVRNLLALASALLLCAGPAAAEKAADTAPVVPEAAPAKSKRTTYPFRGQVESAGADRIVLAKKDGTRPIQLAADSLIERDGKTVPATEVKPGDYVRGLLRKDADGAEVLVKATAGEKPAKTEKPAKAARKEA